MVSMEVGPYPDVITGLFVGHLILPSIWEVIPGKEYEGLHLLLPPIHADFMRHLKKQTLKVSTLNPPK